MKKLQERVRRFNDEREWSDPRQLKDLLLNMNEEIGEFWNLFKWVRVEEQQRLISENAGEAEDFIGDMLYLILKISYICDVDSEKALRDVLDEYESRFPLEKTKGTHANTNAGGVDEK